MVSHQITNSLSSYWYYNIGRVGYGGTQLESLLLRIIRPKDSELLKVGLQYIMSSSPDYKIERRSITKDKNTIKIYKVGK